MRKNLTFILITGLMFLSWKTYSQDPNFHIYLMFGQSNMEGQGPIETPDRVTNSRVKILQDQTCSNLGRVYGQWYTAAPPLNRCWGRLGPGDYFGKTMAEGTPSNVTIGLVAAAVSGCDIAFYQKSAPLGKAATVGGGNADIPSQFTGGYAWLLDLAKKAKTVGVIKGIIFHQGETNTNDPNWKFKVQEIVNNLRTDLGIGNVPFLAGELLYAQYGACCSSHNVEVNKIPGIIPNSYVISASGLPGQDVAHFTSASYRTFGIRYAQKILSLTTTTNTPPTVGLTAPANNSSFTAPAIITINATAADANGTVSAVQFYNGTTLLGADATSPYSFSWTGVGAGTYSITAKAMDNAGAITTSSPVSVTVTGVANTPPTVSITAPVNNASFTAPASITISANAADANGTVSNVQFYNGTTLLGTDATSPYSLSWTGVVAGTYSITARATDNAGAVTTSTAVSVTVTGSTSTADIIGPDCGANNTTLTFELNTSKRANATSYNWWYTGSAASTAAVAGSPFRVTVQTGGSFSAGQICVGTNLSVAPWHTTYCKSIAKCSSAKEGLEDLSMEELMKTTVSPNPSANSFTLVAAEEIQSYTIISNIGSVVVKGNTIVSGQSVVFGESLSSGLYTLRIQYTSGRIETKTIQKVL